MLCAVVRDSVMFVKRANGGTVCPDVFPAVPVWRLYRPLLEALLEVTPVPSSDLNAHMGLPRSLLE